MFRRFIAAAALLLTIPAFAEIDYSAIDCSKINAVSRQQCFERQKAATEQTPSPAQPMTLIRARAIIEAAADTSTQCKINLDVYGTEHEEYKSCINNLFKITGRDMKTYQEALALVTGGIKDATINLFDSQQLTEKIQSTAVNLEYIALRAASN